MNNYINILHLEDNFFDSVLVEDILQENNIKSKIKLVDTKYDFEESVSLQNYDVILADFNLPSYSGVEALKYVLKVSPQTPFIFVSGVLGEESAIESMKMGATDYVLKSALRKLPGAVKRALREVVILNEKLITEKKNQHLTMVLKSIKEINKLIAKEPDNVETIMEKTIEILTANRGYHYSFFASYDSGKIKICKGTGSIGNINDFCEKVSDVNSPSCWSVSCKTNETIKILPDNDICNKCFFNKIEPRGGRVILVKSLKYNNKILGVLHIAINKFFAENQEEIELFTEIADDLAFALHNIKIRKEKIQAEKLLKQSQQNYKELVDNALVGIYKSDLEGKIIFANDSMAQILNCKSVEEVVNSKATEFYKDENIRNEFLKQLFSKKRVSNYEIEVIDSNKNSRNVLVNAYVDNGVITGMMNDISSQKKAENDLKESERKFRKITENSGDLIFTYNEEGFLSYVNKSCCELFGLDKKEIIGRNIKDFIYKNDIVEFNTHLDNLRLKGRDIIRNQLINKNGTLMPVEQNSVILPDGMIYTSARDITQHIRMIDELKKTKLELQFLNQDLEKKVQERTKEVQIALEKIQKSELSLSHSENQFRSLIENSLLGVLIFSMQSQKVTYSNPAISKILDFSEDEFKEKSIIDIHPKDSLNIINRKVDDLFNHGKTSIENIRCINKNKKTVVADLSLVLADLFGKKVIFGFYVDVTEKLKSQNETLKLFQAIEQSPATVVITDKNGIITFVNKAFEDSTGYKAIEAIGRNPRIIKSGFHDKEFYTDMWKTIKSGSTWKGDLLNKRKNGELFWEHSHISPIYDIDGKLQYYVAVKEDITVKKEQEEKLLQAYEDLKITHDELDNTYKELKRTQTQLIQSEKMVALGQLIAGIAHEINSPLGAIKSQNEAFVRDIDNFISEIVAISKLIPSDVLKEINSLTSKSSISENSYVSARDERRLRKEIELELEKMNIKDSRNISQYLLNLYQPEKLYKLHAVLNHNESIRILKTARKMSNLKRGSDIIHESVDRIMKLVLALKSYSHQDIGDDPVEYKISDGIETILTLYHNKIKHSIKIIKNFEYHLPIICYPDELNQVWNNIISNAIHAMNYNGTLTIKISRADDMVVVSISDTGKGISEENKKKIFEPFFTDKPLGEGTGLGLDICKKIIEKHNGKIDFSSKLNEGSTFYVYLQNNFEK